MRRFVYSSRVIDNERQIKLERNVKKVGSWIGIVVKFFVAFFFFVVLNALLNSLAQHTDLISLNTWKFIEEAARVIFAGNASNAHFVYINLMCFVMALTFTCVHEFGLVLKALDKGDENEETKQKDSKREEGLRTVIGCSVVSYKNKVCFLS